MARSCYCLAVLTLLLLACAGPVSSQAASAAVMASNRRSAVPTLRFPEVPAASVSTSSGPLGAWMDLSLPVDQRVAALVDALTLQEKISLLNSKSGAVARLNITAFNWWGECLKGIKEDNPDVKGGTVFPQPLGLAASFDEKIVFDMATIISDEARAKDNEEYMKTGKRRLLNCFSPNINIYRDPRWGRGSETYGEDPHLTARMAVNYVRGLQGDHPSQIKVSATCKHYAAYSLEEAEGFTRVSFNANVSKRDMEDTYGPAFEACVREGRVRSIMCSYNSVNGVPACASSELLESRLRQAWGFDGFVVSDCGAVQSVFWPHKFTTTMPEAHAASLKAGCDMSCEDYGALNDAFAQKLISETDVDQAITRVMTAKFNLGMFDPPTKSPWANISTDIVGSAAHRSKAREAAQKSIVLLKNRDLGGGKTLLPLIQHALKKVVVSGPMAAESEYLLGNYYGIPEGGVVLPFTAIKNKLGEEKVELHWGAKVTGWDTGGIDDTVAACEVADVCILFLGTTSLNMHAVPGNGYDMWSPVIEQEGLDRTDINLPGMQLDLVKAVARRTDTPIVVVLIHGGPLDIQWLEESDRVDAILTAWFPGQGAEAIADVLVGDVSPAGKLPVTFFYNNYTHQQPMTEMDMRKFPGRTYRFAQVPVLYPFGHGLSYSSFSYSGLQVQPESTPEDPYAHVVGLTVTNTGPVDSDHVVLLFLAPGSQLSSTHARRGLPGRQLAAFMRLTLRAGQASSMQFRVPGKLFRHALHAEAAPQLIAGEWHVQAGDISQALEIRPAILGASIA